MLKRMTSIHAMEEETQKSDTVSIASKKSNGSEHTKRTIRKSASDETDKEKPERKPDDLTQMLSRASKNITLVYAKVPSTVLCLSYKVKSSVKDS
jgi:hypothetical protein